MGTRMRVGVFVLFQHELVSQEKKMRTGIDGRRRKTKRKTETKRHKQI